MIFKNTYEILLHKEHGDEKHVFNNLVTDYGKQRLNSGSGYPSTIYLGSNDAEPTSSSSTISNLLGSYSCAPTISTDVEARVCTYSYTLTIGESVLAGKTIRQIGIGSAASQMFTLARFKDSLGKPIDIVKGELERMTVRIVAYVEYQDIDNYGWESVLANMARGNGAMNKNLYAAVGFTPVIKGVALPLATNTQSTTSFGVSGSGISASISLSSSAGSGFLNSLMVLKNIYSKSLVVYQCIDNALFKSGYSAKYPLGSVASDTREFDIPYCTPYKDSIKIYANDVELDKSKYKLEPTSYNYDETTNRVGLMYVDDMNTIRVSTIAYANNSSSYSGSSIVNLSQSYYYEINLNNPSEVKCHKCLFSDIKMTLAGAESKILYPLNKHFVVIYNRNNLYTQVIFVKGSKFVYVKDASGSTAFNTACSPLLYKDDEYSINIEGVKYTANPETMEVSIADNKAYATIGGIPSSKDLTKLQTEKVLIHYVPVSKTKTKRYAVNYDTFEVSESIITHASMRYTPNVKRFIDEDAKVIISIASTGMSSGGVNDYSLYVMNDDLTSITNTINLNTSNIVGNYILGGYNIEKRDTNTYRFYSLYRYYDDTECYVNDVVLSEGKDSIVCSSVPLDTQYEYQYVPWVFEPTYDDFTICPSMRQSYRNNYSIIKYPNKFKLILDESVENDAQIAYSFDTSCIYKNTDWTISTSLKVGTE